MCSFSHIIYLISYVIYLNNTRGWFYKSSHDGVKEISLNFLNFFKIFWEFDFSKLVYRKTIYIYI